MHVVNVGYMYIHLIDKRDKVRYGYNFVYSP